MHDKINLVWLAEHPPSDEARWIRALDTFFMFEVASGARGPAFAAGRLGVALEPAPDGRAGFWQVVSAAWLPPAGAEERTPNSSFRADVLRVLQTAGLPVVGPP